MSAIYGIAGHGDQGTLAAMAGRLAHHGAVDAERHAGVGAWLGVRNGSVGNGFAEIDHLSIVADAAIYNAHELRETIHALRMGFDPRSEAELLLAIYYCFGSDSFQRVNGDYALAIADRRRGVVVLGRDALGNRPLYYWHSGDTLLFASEYKAILADERVPAEPNRRALEYFVRAKYLPAAASLLDGVSAIPPGHWVEFSVRQPSLTVGRHWAPKLHVKDLSQQEHAERVREQFLDAVERRVSGLNEVGANLSGGLDAAAVVAAIRQVRPDLEIYTYTAGHGPADRDMVGAERVARYFETRHRPIEVPPDRIPTQLPEVIWQLEDPIGRSEVLHNDEMARSAARDVDVVLGGYGADVVFGGSQKDKIIRLMQWFPALRVPFGEFYNYTQVSQAPRSRTGHLLKRLYFRNSDPGPAPLIAPEIDPIGTPLPTADREAINHVLAQNLEEPGWLQKDVRMHLARNLQIRTPFLDVGMIRTSFTIPDSLKIRRWREKHILREALRPLLPPDVLQQPKYPHRMSSDLVGSEVLEDYGRSLLTEQTIRNRGFFAYSDVDRILRRPPNRAYSYPHAMRIWTLLVTELWAQIYLDHRGDVPAIAHSRMVDMRS